VTIWLQVGAQSASRLAGADDVKRD
jgi:hypothetical protein